MKSVMRYVSQPGKTFWDSQNLISGIGYHMVQSFPKGADIDPRAVHEAARRLAGYFEGCEILVCTHTDREHIHSRCIINCLMPVYARGGLTLTNRTRREE